MDRKVRAATLSALLGNAVFGFSFMFSRLALNIAPPFVMLAYRFTITAILLILIALVVSPRRHAVTDSGDIDWLRIDLRGRKLLPLIILGLIQPVGYFFCESYGISMTNATVSGVIISLVPIIGIVAGALILREYPSRRQVFFSMMSILAVGWLTLLQSEGGSVRPFGIILLFGAVITGVMFNVMSRKLASGYSVLERTILMMTVAAVIFTALAVYTCRNDLTQLFAPLHSPVFILSITYLAVFSSVIAFMALNFSNNTLPVAKTTAFVNLTTVISLFAGAVFLGEPFNVWTVIASVVIVFCIRQVQAG